LKVFADPEEPEPVAKEVWTSPRFTDATGPTAAVVVPSPADLYFLHF